MATKSVILITLLVVVFAATQAEARLSSLPLGDVLHITGNVSCTVNGSDVVNSIVPIPPFPNALVQLSCNGTVRGTGITNTLGAFSIIVNSFNIGSNLTALLTNCKAVVATPLSACNATLPSTGTLEAPLQYVGDTVVEGLKITCLLVTLLRLAE